MEHQIHTLNRDQNTSGKPAGITSYDVIFKTTGAEDEPTLKMYNAFQKVYNYFHKEMFESKLTPIVLSLNPHSRSRGYYKPIAWINELQQNMPLININPVVLLLGPKEAMSTLVHEMCHHHQHVFGDAGYAGYHNHPFAQLMFTKGLICSSTGLVGGKQIGTRMSHYIAPGGLFERKCNEMPEEYMLPFRPYEKTMRSPQSNKNKQKYRCPTCSDAVWGKPHMEIQCCKCDTMLYSV